MDETQTPHPAEPAPARGNLARRLRLAGALAGLAGCGLPPVGGDGEIPAELAAAHRRYAVSVVRALEGCLGGTPGRPGAAPALLRLCDCYRGFEPSDPLAHRIQLVVGGDGRVRRASDAASGNAASGESTRFGLCEARAMQGLQMPPPPSATSLEIRLTDFWLDPSSRAPAGEGQP